MLLWARSSLSERTLSTKLVSGFERMRTARRVDRPVRRSWLWSSATCSVPTARRPILPQNAAGYADCVGRNSNEAFWKFINAVYAAQSDVTAENADQKLTDIASQSGVDGAGVASCAANPETQSRVQASINLGKSLDVNSTPTLFVNGRPVGVGPNNYDVLKQLVDYSAKQK